MTTRDSERTQVYAAEDLSAEHTMLAAPRSLEELQEVVDTLLSGVWWRSNCESQPAPIAVTVNRSMQRSLWLATRRRISLSRVAMDLSTLCHEFAHAAETDFRAGANNEAVHGRRFRGLHVGVRHALLGKRCGDDLAEVYRQFGLVLSGSDDFTSGLIADPLLSPSTYEAESVTDLGRPVDYHSVQKWRGPIAL